MSKEKNIKIFLLIITIILVLAFVIIFVSLNKKKTETIISKPINETVNLEVTFENIEQIEGMQGFENKEKLSEDEIVFDEYEKLEKKAFIMTNDEKVNEVWMIKLGDYNQQEEICRILGARVKKLKKAFVGNEEQMRILNDTVIKQEDGIVIMIISPYAEEIEKTIAEKMK